MAQLTRLAVVVTLCFLGTVGVAQVTPSGNATSNATPHGTATSSAKPHGNVTSTKVVVLKCSGRSGEFHVKPKPNNPDTVILATHPSCPLTSFNFDQNAPSFTFRGTDSDGNYWYDYDGTPIPSGGYSFKYTTNQKARGGNGTGVIK
jgi:hypothetical protein